MSDQYEGMDDGRDDVIEERITLRRHRYVARYEDSGSEHEAKVTYSVFDGGAVFVQTRGRTT